MELQTVFRFSMLDAKKLLTNKFVVIIGDSNMRCMYKDLVLFLQDDRMLATPEIKRKGERSFLGDMLLEGGENGVMHNGKTYTEVRQYCHPYHLVRFYFVTRAYNSYMESILDDLGDGRQPDIVIMNSCLWDVSRYGPDAMREYKENLRTLFRRFKEVLPSECLVLWTTTMPIASYVKGGFVTDEIRFLEDTLRVDVLVGNYVAANVAREFCSVDVLDLHFLFRHDIKHRSEDGIHWDHIVHREISNILLRHICNAWDVILPEARNPHPHTDIQAMVRLLSENYRHDMQ